MTNEQIEFLKKLAEAHGIIVQACAMSKTSRTKYYKWLKEKEFKQNANEIILSQKEFVESKLLELIDANDTTAIIFYLKTKGKDLGYSDKVEAVKEKKKKIKLTHISNDEIERNKNMLIDLMMQQNKYEAFLLPQIEQVAQLIARRNSFLTTISSPDYSPVSVQISREGNERISVNPVELMYKDYCERVQAGLRALGLNTDSKNQIQSSDSLSDFINSFTND